MTGFQIAALVIMAVFYIAYYTKMLLQRRRGIQTNQIAKGEKPAKTRRVEVFMKIATLAIVAVEVVSILLNTQLIKIQAVAIAGLVLAAVGVAVFVAAMVAMKDSWRAGIPATEKTSLVQFGIYRFSRNPAFLGFDLLYLGILLAYMNVVHLVFAAFAITMLHLQILEEENFLSAVFGDAYLAYKNKTRRYFLFF